MTTPPQPTSPNPPLAGFMVRPAMCRLQVQHAVQRMHLGSDFSKRVRCYVVAVGHPIEASSGFDLPITMHDELHPWHVVAVRAKPAVQLCKVSRSGDEHSV